MNSKKAFQTQENQLSLEQNLYNNTLLILGEMLKILRQEDSKETRNKLKSYCQDLSVLGKKANLPRWVELLETATVAIADTNNPYTATTKLIIKEIKQASENVINHKSEKIRVSSQLQELVPDSFLKLMDLEDICAEIDKTEIDKDSINRDLWKDTNKTLGRKEDRHISHLEQFSEFEISKNDSWLEETQVIENNFDDTPESINDWFDDEYFEEETENTSSGYLKPEGNATFTNYPESLEEINLLLAEDKELEENELEDDIFDILEQIEDNEQGTKTEVQRKPENLAMAEDEEIFSTEIDDLLDQPLDEIPDSIIRAQTAAKNLEPPAILYEDFEELERFIEKNSGLEKEISGEALNLFPQNLTSYYEQFEELDTLINSEMTAETSVNWQGISNLIEDGHKLVPETISKTAKPQLEEQEEQKQPIVEQQLSDLDQLLAQAQSSLAKPQWKGKPSKTKSSAQLHQKPFEQNMRVPVKQMDNLNNLVGEMVVRRNRLEEDQDRLRQFLDNLLGHVQNLSDVGAKMQDLYERSLLEGALLASRGQNRATVQEQLERSQKKTITYNSNLKANDNLGLDELELDRFTGFHLLSQDIIELIVRVRESTSDIQFLVDETEQLGRNLREVTTQLQEEINKSRMVAFAQTAERLPRAVRDISRFYNKEVELKVEGKEVLVDKMILEHLWDPIQQLVKNAITHGIEVPEIRQAMGKEVKGTITIRTFLQGPQTVIAIGDDGAGINPNKVKQKAIENKLITKAQAANLTNQDLYEFLFHPGFSTKDKADSHAGRGVGLDIVRSKLNEVRGTVSIDSHLGKGTTFTIRLPLTLTIGKALCCINESIRIAFPIDAIEDTKDYKDKDIQVNEQGQKCIPWRNTLLPFRPLNTLLTYNRQASRSMMYSNNSLEEKISIIVLRGGNNLLAIQVDQVIPEEEEIVIKQISGPLPKPKGIAGATVRSDGIVMPIGDVIELIDIAQGNLSKDVAFPTTGVSDRTLVDVPVNIQPLILIVDDSITVREMLSISFNKAGYRVEQARDGEDAWQKLRSGLPCDLVFCDIEMPRMNGLELLQHIQADSSLSEIPVAILSSRAAEKHQKIAADLGASAYLIKPYVEKDLIDSARRMMDGEVLLSGSTKQAKQAKQTKIIDQSKINLTSAKYHTKSSPTVLIIDDSVVVREMLSMTFKKAGYQVEQARDGQDAWEKLSGGLECDIALCDIEMPRMNGLELLAKMQQDDYLSQIPVAMVTSRGAEKHRRIAADLGAKAYFTKPYLEEELLEATKSLIRGDVLLNSV
jgi:chemosensory pili system protein ChpA (sensor histidine kinase/response regulator)